MQSDHNRTIRRRNRDAEAGCSARSASCITEIADLKKNRAAITPPTPISGQREAETEVAAAASSTPTLAIRSLREHVHVELMFRLSAR